MIFIPNRKVSTPDHSSVSREGKSLDLTDAQRHRDTEPQSHRATDRDTHTSRVMGNDVSSDLIDLLLHTHTHTPTNEKYISTI